MLIIHQIMEEYLLGITQKQPNRQNNDLFERVNQDYLSFNKAVYQYYVNLNEIIFNAFSAFALNKKIAILDSDPA